MKTIICFLMIIFCFFIFLTCTTPGQNGNPAGDANITVTFHDKPFEEEGKTVEKLILHVVATDIVDNSTDEVIYLLTEDVTVDILQYTAENPLTLSDTIVPAGNYSQLRFVLAADNVIVIDGVDYPIRIPSGEQSGLKINGPFDLAEGQVLTIDLDLLPAESVLYIPAQGYKLKPVIKTKITTSDKEEP